MEEHREEYKSFSFENGDSSEAINVEDEGGEDEQFYEKIEAPKFVDFNVPDHFCPDDRYWFCVRAGCDQKHEEVMDSEEIYRNFVLRVIAARSPNVKLRRTLNRNASRTLKKCPHSAPPKSSKSRLAVISSISQKIVNEKPKVVRQILKPEVNPKSKTRPVAAKYLTTPRNKNCVPNPNSFRSVQNVKPNMIESSKTRSVAKTLVFHSPRKGVKVKTSVELHSPVEKLCEGMKRLENTSQKKPFIGYSRKLVKNLESNREHVCSQAHVKQETESVRSVRSKTKVMSSKQCAMKEDFPSNLGVDVKTSNLEDAPQREEYCLPNAEERLLEGNTNSIFSEKPDRQENDGRTKNELKLGSKNREHAKDKPVEAEHNSSKGEINGNKPVESDDKENSSVFDENRFENSVFSGGDTHKQNGTKIKKVAKVAPALENPLQDNVALVLKLQKPKPTTPKPFRLRTDERRMHKEANLERKINFQSPQDEITISTILSEKLQIKEVNNQKESKMMVVQEREKTAATRTPQRHHVSNHQELTPPQSNATQRLEKFRKMTSPLKQHSIRPQGRDLTRKEMHGSKLEVIREKTGNLAGNVRRPVTIGKEPNFHCTRVPRNFSRNNLT